MHVAHCMQTVLKRTRTNISTIVLTKWNINFLLTATIDALQDEDKVHGVCALQSSSIVMETVCRVIMHNAPLFM